MKLDDRKPLEGSAVCGKIRTRGMNNRLGAVYASLHSFWTARQAAFGIQSDANTIILHAEGTQSVCENDTTSSPNELLDLLLPNAPKGGNSFNKALKAADAVITRCWDDTRPPVIIFLSDGIASVTDNVVRNLFRTTAQKGYVAFNPIFDAKLTLDAGKDFRCTPSYSVRKRLLPGWSTWSPLHSMRRARHPR